MNRISKITQVLIFILLMLVSIYCFCFIENKTISYLISSLAFLIFIVLIVYVFIRKSNRNKYNLKIVQETPRVNARILSVKPHRFYMVLQLLVEHPTKENISSLIIENNKENRDNYEAGKNIHVFVDPKDPYNVIIPGLEKANAPGKKINWFLLIYIPAISGSFLIPFIIGMFDTSDRLFQDIQYLQVNGKQENIWEVRFERPDKLFIRIYDPLTNIKVKSIKDKKDTEIDSPDFFISQQNNKVFIINAGTTPVIDIYDAATFEKLSDIKKFEESETILYKGISEIQLEWTDHTFVKDDIIAITTNDGNKSYYDITNDKFYYSEKDLNEYIQKTVFDLLRWQMFSFVLSTVPNSVDKHQLYIIKTNDIKGIDAVQNNAGKNSFDVDYFTQNKKHYFKNCDLESLSGDNYFLKAKIIYFDATLVVIQHVTEINVNADELISGIDKSGNTLFTIKQSDYPDTEEMTEDNYTQGSFENSDIIRIKDKIVFLFGKYGALCVDIKTGNIIWKLEL